MGCSLSITVPAATFSKDSVQVEDLTSKVDHHNVVRQSYSAEKHFESPIPSAPSESPVVYAQRVCQGGRGRAGGQRNRRGAATRRGAKKNRSGRNFN